MKTYFVKLKTSHKIEMELTLQASTPKQAEFRVLNLFPGCVILAVVHIQIEQLYKESA